MTPHRLGATPVANRPLRVLHVIHRLALGGTEFGVIKVVNHLDRTRFQPYICSLRPPLKEASAALRDDVPVLEVDRAEGLDLRMLLRLRGYLRRERIDIVHSHNWTTFLYSVLAARSAGVPVVIHGEHGRETAEVTREWRRLTLERLLARGVDRFTAVSRDLCTHIAEDWGVNPAHIQFIPNGVPLDRFDSVPETEEARLSIGAAASDQVVGSVGAFRDVKDFESLVRAFAIVRTTRPRARLVLAGFDPDGRFERRMERELPGWDALAPSIRFLGVRTDVAIVLAAMDVYVNSSIYEGMSNTILEAMAVRRPVVATRVGGTPDLVEDSVTGWMVPSRNPDALAERIGWCLDHPDEARAMGQAGRLRLEARHNFEDMVARNAQVYDSAFARQATPRRATHRVRALAGDLARGSGLLALARRRGEPVLTVLAYHNVAPYSHGHGLPGGAMRLPLETFEEQIEALGREYHPMTAAEVLRHYEDRTPFPRGAVWVTFDDGYADNFHHAWPVLRRYRVPATIFLATDPIDRGSLLWWDDLAESCRRLRLGDPSLLAQAASEIGGRVGDLLARAADGTMTFANAIDAAIGHLNQEREATRSQTVARLQELSTTEGDTGPGRRVVLTWDQVRTMASEDVTFGGHTASHAFLDTLGDAEASVEIEGCLSRIAAETGERPVSFAYPRGRSNDRSRLLLAKHGVRLAVTTVPGGNDLRTDPLSLRRRDAGHLAFGLRFSRGAFDLEMAGWLDGRHR
jgi:sugar transferase (PEP-CTERM/EpsH1 system associated)